jgi:hypothetical protein
MLGRMALKCKQLPLYRIHTPITHRDVFHRKDVLFRCFRVSQCLSLAKQGIL